MRGSLERLTSALQVHTECLLNSTLSTAHGSGASGTWNELLHSKCLGNRSLQGAGGTVSLASPHVGIGDADTKGHKWESWADGSLEPKRKQHHHVHPTSICWAVMCSGRVRTLESHGPESESQLYHLLAGWLLAYYALNGSVLHLETINNLSFTRLL